MHRHASLNRFYRLVWSSLHGAWIAVAENAKGRGKSASRRMALAAALISLAHAAQAGPTGGQVVSGAARIEQSGAHTTITQSSQNASLTWQSFDTASNETVTFAQPSRGSVAVNRILGVDGTQFMGKLNANGQVFVINPNGIVFGAGSQVNVGGLVASALDLDPSSLDGSSRRFAGPGAGAIVGRGAIQAAPGGYVAFLGNKVDNQGSIAAPSGSVALGAGSDVTLSFAGSSLVKMQVNQGALDAAAQNGGLIQANGGAVVLSAGAKNSILASVVNNSGVIEARSAQNVNGQIILEGGSQSAVANSGTLDASGKAPGQTGGVVNMLGASVALTPGGSIDVSGDAGGGVALVGGNFHGAGPEMNAQNASVAQGSLIRADAVSRGQGGQVALWSDGATEFQGAISAKGGAQSGSGGQVETSGHTLRIGAGAQVDTSASSGRGGDWLLDPADITIGSFADMKPAFPNIDVDSAAITNALNYGNVTIKTTATSPNCVNASCGAGHPGNGDIVLLDTIGSSVTSYDGAHTASYANWTQGNYTLTLSAYRDVVFKVTPNYFSPGANTTYGAGGSIDLGSNPNGGQVVLRADNAGRGVGTVTMEDLDGSQGGWNSIYFGSPSSSVKIYYNPSSYGAPTNYSQLVYMGDPNQVSSYMAINLTAAVASKTYDSTTAATFSGLSVLGGTPAGVTVNASGATASFLDKTAGLGKPTLISGVTLSGSNASQYYLNGLDAQTASISKANLTVSGVTANDKTYNATTAASLAGTASVVALGGDVVSVAGSGVGAFADKNVGVGKSVAVSGYALAGADAGNYNIVQPQNLTANIYKAGLSINGLTANSRNYDGTTNATLSGTATVAALGSDVVTVTGAGAAAFADKNVGSAKALTVTGYTLGGADAGNYDVVQPAGLTATINKATLSLGGVSVADKVYDATTSATLTGTAAVTGIAGDDVSVTGSGSATFADKNVGVNKAVTVSGYTLGGLDAGNYALAPSGGLTASISKADLALGGISASNKTYNGATDATITGSAVVSQLGGDAVSVAGSGAGSAFADKNAGTGKAVTVAGYTLTGADAGNYNLVAPTNLSADIAKASLNIIGVTANSRDYDATANAALSGAAAVAALGSDVVTVTGTGSATFADKNAGSSKAVTVTGYALGGADAGNYDVVQPTGLTATINKAAIAVAGLSATNKVYDGTTAAALSGAPTIAGFGGDDVSVTGSGSGSFADKNVGANKTVTVLGYTLGGLDAGNYRLIASTTMADITKLNLTVSGIAAVNKTYDGTTAATIGGSAGVVALGSDVVSVAGSGIGSAFADKNAGTGKTVVVAGYALTGADAGNYNLVAPTGLTADIAKASLNITGLSAHNRAYDATANATLSGAAAVAALGSDVVTVTGTGSATFADKNAGSGKAVTVTGYTLGGADAGNYNVIQPTGLTATISKANLSLSGLTAADKTYDGTSAASVTGTASVAAFGSDLVALSGSGVAAFADKNAGVGKAITVGGFTLTGDDAGNYNLAQPAGLTATIAKADLALNGIAANGKIYDSTTAATLSGNAGVAALGGDVVAVVGVGAGSAFATKNAGAGKAVTVAGYSLTGADAGNYNLVVPTNLTADIAKANLNVIGITPNNKTYDGAVNATLGGVAAVAAFGADVVNVGGIASATFADKNAGSGKAVTVSGFTLTGADAANYNIVQPSGIFANIAKANLALGGLSASNKVYDGTTAATLSGGASVSPIGSDEVFVLGSGSAAFQDKNAGQNKAVIVSGFSLAGADAANYALLSTAGLSANIAKADLAISGLSAQGKTYDGSAAAALSGAASVAALAGDSVSLTGSASGAFVDKNAGQNKAVNVVGLSLSGADAANYQLVGPSLRADIAKADLAISGVSIQSKTYDGSASATLSGTAFVSPLGWDAVSVRLGQASFADKNAGHNKAVTLSGFSLEGADAANYNAIAPTGLSADIAKARLSLEGLSAADKVYDATTRARLVGSARVSAMGSDDVSVSGLGQAAFQDKNAGRDKAVTVSGFSLSGADAANYELAPAQLSASISKATLGVAGLRADNKTYDGSAAATLSGSARADALAGDDVSISGRAVASFNDKNAGQNKAVTVLGLSLSGADASNYDLVQPAGLRADIAKANLSVGGILAKDKTFDGSSVALTDASRATLSGLIAGDQVQLISSSGSFADSAVGQAKTVNLRNAYAGADLGNYEIVDQTSAQASIKPAASVAGSPVAQAQAAVQAALAPPVLTAPTPSTTVVEAREDKPRQNQPSSYLGVRLGAGLGAPALRVENGGVRLPAQDISQ